MSRDPNTAHPRMIGWIGTTALAMGGSNQSLFLIGALIVSQGSAAVPLLMLGLLLSWAAAFGWTELVLMWPNRVGGIAATCAEAFRPYSPILANLTGVCYWWGWVPTCGLTAILSATAITEWYLPRVPVPLLASLLVLGFMFVNLCGVRWVTRLAIPLASLSAALAFLSGVIPVVAGQVDWRQAFTFHLINPFPGFFGGLTSAMAGLYLVGFAAPAFEAATCHVGETIRPERNVPRAVFASGFMATIYFAFLPIIWLGVLGPAPLTGDLAQTLGPTYAPWLGALAHAAAIWFMMFNMFHGTLQPLAGAARTLAQLAEDGLLPRVLARRSRTDAPWVATLLTAGVAIAFLLTGDPTWIIAAANLTYLIGICLPNVAVWLLRRDEPDMPRPYRAPRGTIVLGLMASVVWGIATLLGFEQFGLPTVIAGLVLAYSGSILYALRRWDDRRREGKRLSFRSLHLKLTGAMLLVLALDGSGYVLAISCISSKDMALITGLEDIFVAVAILTISVGLVLPGMIGHAVGEVARVADQLATGTLADLADAMQALQMGNLEKAEVRVDITPIVVRSKDEVGGMAASFNTMQAQLGLVAVSLYGAREGLSLAYAKLKTSNTELQVAHDELATLAITDHLTGLPNHRALVATLAHELERATRYSRPCSILFVDLDHFKALNDSCGHAAGDAVLRELGEVIRESLRNIDTVGRWGGEEFLAVLPEADEASALAAAERVRVAVAGHVFGVGGGTYLTCSLGIAVFPLDATDRSHLVEAADRAMYAAKKLGRNQVRTASEPAVLLVDGGSRAVGSREDVALTGAVEALAALVEARDQYTGDHTSEVATLATQIALRLGLSEADARMVGLAGHLHDLGKVAIPDDVLQKPSGLTPEEWELMRTHPVVGADVVSRMPSLRVLVPAIRGHHERWDGEGYPDRLSGEDIALGARIIAVADAYGAMTTDRPYRKAGSPSWAMRELRRCAGVQFDPTIVDALEQVLSTTMPLALYEEAV
ncbi:MAG TPA: amino acid permease [Ktedonobacteraceae bacterium]|nr:amino acid permease [Ktedonobacteraceae bacterium]